MHQWDLVLVIRLTLFQVCCLGEVLAGSGFCFKRRSELRAFKFFMERIGVQSDSIL